MADSVGEEANGSVGTAQDHGAQLSASLGNSIPGHSAASPPSTGTPVAVVAPGIPYTITPAVESGLGVLTHAVDPTIPVVAVPPTLPPGIGSGVPAGAGLLSQIHATSWDPTLSTDWDKEKASQQCILRIKR